MIEKLRAGIAISMLCGLAAGVGCSSGGSSAGETSGQASEALSEVDSANEPTCHAHPNHQPCRCGDGGTGLGGIGAPVGTTVTASGSYGAPANAIDENIATGWNAGDYTGWIELTFPSAIALDGLRIAAGSEPNTPETYTITGYDDGKAAVLGSFTDEVDGNDTLPPMLFAGGTYKRIRVDVQGNLSWVAINEISILTSHCGGGGGGDAGTGDSGAQDSGSTDSGSDTGTDSGSQDASDGSVSDSGSDADAAAAVWVVATCQTEQAGMPHGVWEDSDGTVFFTTQSTGPSAGAIDTGHFGGTASTPLTPAALTALLAAAQTLDSSTAGYTTINGTNGQEMPSSAFLYSSGKPVTTGGTLVDSYSGSLGKYTWVRSNDPAAATLNQYCGLAANGN